MRLINNLITWLDAQDAQAQTTMHENFRARQPRNGRPSTEPPVERTSSA
jgi:hypothetical protein